MRRQAVLSGLKRLNHRHNNNDDNQNEFAEIGIDSLQGIANFLRDEYGAAFGDAFDRIAASVSSLEDLKGQGADAVFAVLAPINDLQTGFEAAGFEVVRLGDVTEQSAERMVSSLDRVQQKLGSIASQMREVSSALQGVGTVNDNPQLAPIQ